MHDKVYQVFAQYIIQIIFLSHSSAESKRYFTKLAFHDNTLHFLNLCNHNLAFQTIFIKEITYLLNELFFIWYLATL